MIYLHLPLLPVLMLAWRVLLLERKLTFKLLDIKIPSHFQFLMVLMLMVIEHWQVQSLKYWTLTKFVAPKPNHHKHHLRSDVALRLLSSTWFQQQWVTVQMMLTSHPAWALRQPWQQWRLGRMNYSIKLLASSKVFCQKCSVIEVGIFNIMQLASLLVISKNSII